jgi:ATP-binding cassette subfamily B protein
MNNPYISLLKAAWKYAREEKKLFLTIYLMFLGANIVAAIGPWWYGQAIDHIQKNKDKVLYYAVLYAAGVIGLKFLEWSFHGPARVMERSLAFRAGISSRNATTRSCTCPPNGSRSTIAELPSTGSRRAMIP